MPRNAALLRATTGQATAASGCVSPQLNLWAFIACYEVPMFHILFAQYCAPTKRCKRVQRLSPRGSRLPVSPLSFPHFWALDAQNRSCLNLLCWGRGGVVVRLLASYLGEPGSIPDGVVPGFSHVGIVADDAAGGRALYGDLPSPSLRPFNPTLLRTYLASPSSALKTSLLRAAQISAQLGMRIFLTIVVNSVTGPCSEWINEGRVATLQRMAVTHASPRCKHRGSAAWNSIRNTKGTRQLGSDDALYSSTHSAGTTSRAHCGRRSARATREGNTAGRAETLASWRDVTHQPITSRGGGAPHDHSQASRQGTHYTRSCQATSYAWLHHRGSKLDPRSDLRSARKNRCTIRVQRRTGDRDEVHFEPSKSAVRNLDPRSAAIVEKCSLKIRQKIELRSIVFLGN
ncbi:hypothetical protein PR048_032211 [Dryococelus australis]|uniref:Uncharacterized protein n=1 Tax=Dryococelus australis TaxID=614101 RepID=A0ABQ9G4T4_9NEOP|nr:hypothetical protein PR048_032211 [Dryococelus australis]